MTKYCGSNRPPLLSWDSPLFIRFESNTNMPGTGFSAVYAMTCKCMFVLILCVPVKNISVMLGWTCKFVISARFRRLDKRA